MEQALTENELEKLIMGALREILRHEDFHQLLDWLQNSLGVSSQLSILPGAEEHKRILATNLALALWNATPLPGNGFRPDPVPKPKRNQPCICGSGKKYKKCCDPGPLDLPQMETLTVWPLLFDAMPAKRLKKAVRGNELPLEGRLVLGSELLEKGEYQTVIELLEPFYQASTPARVDEEAGYGMNLLCDAYDAVGAWERKLHLLEHVCSHAPASALRSEALQRRAGILADDGDIDAAFALLKQARKDTPGDPTVNLLEVQLLLVKGNLDQAVKRAVFLRKQIEREMPDMDEEDNPMLAFLDQVIDDPETARSMLQGIKTGMDEQFVELLEKLPDRPAAVCGFEELVGMAEDDPDSPAGDRPRYMVVSPPDVRSTEEAWRRIRPTEPLFGTSLLPMVPEDPWDEENSEWQDFILSTPEALDSMEIIDDLLVIFNLHPAWGDPGYQAAMYEPLLDRGLDLVEAGHRELPERGCLPWVVAENRPLLRILMREIQNAAETEDYASVYETMELALGLNPDDNHGLRAELINVYLFREENEKALALARQYPEDILPEILYGEVLALFRLGHRDAALEAARRAKRKFPLVASYLCASRRAKPKGSSSPFGRIPGGREEAWEYRQSMRDIWKATRGALSWLKKA